MQIHRNPDVPWMFIPKEATAVRRGKLSVCLKRKEKEPLADFIQMILSRLNGRLELFLAPLLCLGSARSPGPEGEPNSGFTKRQT